MGIVVRLEMQLSVLGLLFIADLLLSSLGFGAERTHRGARPDLVTVMQEASLFYNLENVSVTLKRAAEDLKKTPTPEAHLRLGRALQSYLAKKGFRPTVPICNKTCFVALRPSEKDISENWLQASANRLASDPILPAVLGFDTSFITEEAAYFDSESEPPRTGLDWVDLATTIMSAVSGHELRHWKHEQIRESARRTSSWRKTYKDLLTKANFLPAISLSHWRKGIQYFNPDIQNTYGPEDGFAIEEMDTNFYNA
ncbi:MAG: hypothetical protein K2X47_02145, partial [Bdellovibrionales bacterium]|nr:hypothetical protein [Bdellovibrionales bacterium]